MARVASVLFNLEHDTSEQADEVRQSLNMSKFIPTTEDDFKHTLALLDKAGVTPEFTFSY